MFLTLLGASVAGGRTGVAAVALGLAAAGTGVVPATGTGGASLGVGASGAAVTTTRATGVVALGLGGTGTGRVRVAGGGGAALQLSVGAVGQLPVRGSGACALGLAATGRGGRVIAVRVVDRTGVRLLALDQTVRRMAAVDSTQAAVVPLLTEAGVGLLTEASELLELEEAGSVALTLPWRLGVVDRSASLLAVTTGSSQPRILIRESPPIPTAAR
jgi:hypothetical protein